MSNFDDLLTTVPNENEQSTAPEYDKAKYAENKKNEREEVFALSDQTSLRVVADSKPFEEFLALQARFDRYSAINALLIYAQKPEATKIADFDYWRDQGCYIKADEKAFSIIEPGNEYKRNDGSIGVSFNVKKVFDISQLNTNKIKEVEEPSLTERQILKALINKAPALINGVDELPYNVGAQYVEEENTICVRKGMEFSDIFRSIAQELALCSLTNRSDSHQFNPGFLAYCVSYQLCKKYGVDTKDFNFDGVSNVFSDMDATGIKKELSIVRDIAEEITGRMERELRPRTPKNQDAR